MRKKAWLILLAVLACLGLAFFFRKILLFHFLSLPDIIHWVERARSNPVLTLLFYALFVFGVMFLPITLFPIVGGVLVDFSWALPLNLAAATCGAFFSYLSTRTLGRERIHNFLKGRWAIVDHLTGQQGFKSVLLLRLIGIPPFIVTNYALGLSAVRPRDFVLGTLVGILPWMAIVTYAADSLWQAAVVGGEHGFRAALLDLVTPLMLISGAILLSTIVGLVRKRKKKVYSNL